MMNSNIADFANVKRPTELIGIRGLAIAIRKDGSRRTSAVQWSMNGAAAPAVQPPAPNSAVPADLQLFVNPPSLTKKLQALTGKEQQNRYTVVPGGSEMEYDAKGFPIGVVTRPSMVLDNSTGRLVDLGAQQGRAQPAASPYPDGTRLTGKDGKVYTVKNGQPVLETEERNAGSARSCCLTAPLARAAQRKRGALGGPGPAVSTCHQRAGPACCPAPRCW